MSIVNKTTKDGFDYHLYPMCSLVLLKLEVLLWFYYNSFGNIYTILFCALLVSSIPIGIFS